MTTRLEAAASAICGYAKDDEPCEDCNGEAAAALAASDAVLLSDATVERAARAIFPSYWDDDAPECFETPEALAEVQAGCMDHVRAVLAAAVKEDGE